MSFPVFSLLVSSKPAWHPEHPENPSSQRPLSVFSCPHPPPCTRGLLADVGRHSHTLNLNLGVTCFFLASLPYWLPPKSQPFTGKRTPLLPKHRLPRQPPLKKRSTLQASRLGPRLPLLAHNGWEAAGRQATARRPCGGSWGECEASSY